MMTKLTSPTPIAGDGVLTEDHPVLRRLEGEGTQVEQLVMQRAQGKPVRLDVRSTHVVPLDVGGLEPGADAADPQVEAADAAPVLVRP